ncbi:hypothetical protein SAMN04487939_10380 [Lysobacter sp. yr284]|uniref:hypothetical protein n=1 Tax=Lysobacter sp. yr284 TaxID=1761791 RepID=UPI00089D034B|nr:hypothetical protein [Lysobacter sp. yr284]SDY53918.1 hypothetical protein SAMN04487939_10380 [Lysobacter sp. yr284]
MDAARARVVVVALRAVARAAPARVGVRARHGGARAALAAALLCAAAALPAQRRILPASKPPPPPCVQVRIGHDEAGRWDCVNDAIKSEVDKVAPVVAADSPGERLAPIGQGLAVPAATRQRLGDQYGKSVVPQRPDRSFPATPLSRPPVR